MRATRTVGMLLLLLYCMGSVLAQQPFTYQGMLKTSGIPASGNYDFQFSLWTAVSGGSQVGSTITRIGVSVSNGLFTTELDFGSVWDGNERYLQIAVRPSGSGSYTTLSPRVKVNRVPYSQLAYSALTVPWSGIIGAPSSFPPGGSAGGDLSGSYPNPTVAKLQGRPVSNNAPTAGQVLKWDGSAWSPGTDLGDTFWQASGSNIFYNAGNVGISTSSPLYPLHVETGTGTRAIYGLHTAPNGINYGVWGQSASTDGRGVSGRATASSGDTYGVWGQSASTDGTGVYGLATASSGFTYGVFGQSNSTDGRGVFGWTNASSGTTYGVYGRSDSPSGYGAFGLATAGSGFTYGVYGQSDSPSGRGVYGLANATSGINFGVYGSTPSTSGRGVAGEATAMSGETYGVYGRNLSTSGIGVYGEAVATSGSTTGVYGRSNSPDGAGVYGEAGTTSGFNYGLVGRSYSTSGTGVFGWASTTSGTTYGVYGRSDSPDGTAVFGWVPASSGNTFGVIGQSDSFVGRGVLGYITATTGLNVGVWGQSSSVDGRGLYGYKPPGGSGSGVFYGNGLAGTGTKSFQMDHPLSPETHYLNHFCTEGPEPYNAYSGNITTDARGYATITLPNYFDSINRDFRYQLTVIDDSDDFVLAKVVREIQNNQFVIRTNKPHVKVSWRVEAIRNDLWVQAYGYQTEQPKPPEHRGKYLNPELYGQPKELGIYYLPEPKRPNEVEKPK